MSSWTTITLTVDYDDDVENSLDELQEKILEYVKNEGGKASTYETHGGDLFVKPCGIMPKDMLEELKKHWGRAVVIDTNDTGDTGTAVLYEKDYYASGEPSIYPRDKFMESQKDRTDDTGRRAAAYMMFTHGIDARADYNSHWEHTEKQVGYGDDNDA